VVHGVIEVLGEPAVELEEVPGERWHRWVGADPTDLPAMGPIALPPVVAHSGVRAPFRFPDGTRADLVLTADGWRTRASAFS
jgi:hypothetical protein